MMTQTPVHSKILVRTHFSGVNISSDSSGVALKFLELKLFHCEEPFQFQVGFHVVLLIIVLYVLYLVFKGLRTSP